MRIIGPPSALRSDVQSRLAPMGAAPLFTDDMFPALWNAAVTLTIDPVGMIAQSYKETGGGRFTGRVPATFFNPCGMKVRDTTTAKKILNTTDDNHTLLHQQFWSWSVGALAQAQHLRAYAGWPVDGLIVDPRYDWVIGKHAVEDFEGLSEKWAWPGVGYGEQIVGLARRLQGRA